MAEGNQTQRLINLFKKVQAFDLKLAIFNRNVSEEQAAKDAADLIEAYEKGNYTVTHKVKFAPKEQVKRVAKKLINKYEDTFRKLAE